MIYNFMFVTASGVVLYHQEFTHGIAQPRLVGGLLTALEEFSRAAVGVPVAHIRMKQMSLTLVEAPFMRRAETSDHHTLDRTQSELEGMAMQADLGLDNILAHRPDAPGLANAHVQAEHGNGDAQNPEKTGPGAAATAAMNGGSFSAGSNTVRAAPALQGTADRLMCVLFHSVDGSHDLAALLASQLLSTFMQQNSVHLEVLKPAQMSTTDKFARFSEQVINVLKQAYRPIMQDLDRNTLVDTVWLIHHDQTFRDFERGPSRSLMYVSNNANVRGIPWQIVAMMNAAHDLMSISQQVPQAIRVGRTLLLQHLGNHGLLLVVNSDNLDKPELWSAVDRTRCLLNELQDLLTKYHGSL
ncbi:hypothetical protein FVE85_4731 [Porphyridium purpureum]|uniref:Uncharacterized protein n=1 Tax=Porphyridium purpureum TaxID=35688 RepID=A0A5J4YSB9_PORPP|nr:hypothetical protein FVE85_4731 [Porphyridium purpureum]|eukprot:POR6069..scf236_6